ncbi:MAG: urease accessory protein UreD [Pseudomonadota bacterium]
MLDTAPTQMQRAQLQRARGTANVALGAGGRITGLRQAGSAKVMLPRTHGPVPEAVFLNTAGGLTGGDDFTLTGAIGDGASGVLTTQTAERAYASTGDAANVTVTLSAGEGSTLHWLPQETILFEGSNIARRTRIDMGAGARVVACETIMLGRAAMGETLSAVDFQDRREIWRGGAPVWAEALSFDGSALTPAAALSSARAVTTVVVVGQGAEDLAPALPDGFAATGWDGRWIARGWGDAFWPLKRGLAQVLEQVCGRPIPRVWQM